MSVSGLSSTIAGYGSVQTGSSFLGGISSSNSLDSDLIGLTPTNVTNMGFGASSLSPSFATGTSMLSPFGYGNALGQYGSDQLSFAFSQGDYTASGATPQTYLQNQLYAASSFSQPPLMLQTTFNTISLQNNVFAPAFQATDAYGFGSPYVGTGLGTANVGTPSAFVAATTTTSVLNPGLTSDSAASTVITGSNDGLTALGLPAIVGTTVTTGVGSTAGQISALGGAITQSGTQLASGTGLTNTETNATLHGSELGNSSAAALNGSATGNSAHASLTQDVSHTVTSVTQLLSADHLSIATPGADPFAHYSPQAQAQGQQAVPNAGAADAHASDAQGMINAAATLAADHLDFSDHVVVIHGTNDSHAVVVHLDPVGHALQQAADALGHLV